jgi:hypothetical protein
MDDPIERHLDELFNQLSGTGHTGRRALAEAEDHLRAAAADGVKAGLSEVEAARQAVARFGDPARIAASLRANSFRSTLAVLLSGAWLMGAIGLIAIGVSGLLAEVFGRAFSPNFVSGDSFGVTYTSERCADYFEYFPNAASCANAAELHHWGEVVETRVAAGILGLLALGVYLLARRFTRLPAPPPGPFALVAFALFALAGVALTFPVILEAAFGGSAGLGANLSGGIIALIAATAIASIALKRRAATGLPAGRP